MTDSEKFINLIQELRAKHNFSPEHMAMVHALVGLIRYSEIVKK